MILVNAELRQKHEMPPPVQLLAETHPFPNWVHFRYWMNNKEYEAWGGGTDQAGMERIFHETYFANEFTEPYTVIWLNQETVIRPN